MKKDKEKFFQLYDKAMDYTRKKKLKESLEVLYEMLETTDYNDRWIEFEISELLFKLKRSDEGFLLLEKLFFKDKSFVMDYIFDIPEYKEFLDTERLQKIIQENKKNVEKYSKGTIPPYKIIGKENLESKDFLLLFIHGNNPFIEIEVYDEFVLVLEGLLKEIPNISYGLLSSSRCGMEGAPLWYDYKQGAIEVSKSIKEIQKKYSIPDEKTIVMGFSAGGGVLHETLVLNELQITNAMFLMPHLPKINEYKNHQKRFKEEQIKIYIYSGTKDFLLHFSEEFSESLSKDDIEHKLEIEDGLTHRFPEERTLFIRKMYNYFKEN